jgi:phage baseplate assembly protein gpV|tara:strand:- start:509 stop:1210 length:702 start_codon:yes stop_codon:yes gene_type:complete
MASTFSSDLKLELMVTGENAGTWGDKTNTNLNLVQQAVAGFESIDVASADVGLLMSDATISNARNATIKLTGTLAANRTVTIPDSIEKVYNVIDGTNHDGNTLTFKTSSGTGILLCEGNCYTLYSDGTNIEKANEYKKWRVISAAETVQAGAQLFVDTNGGAVTVTLPASPSTGDEVTFNDQRLTFDSNNLTVGRNGSNILGAAGDLVVATEGAAFTLVYSGNATTGWTYKDK